jgi:hypothetical protein
MKKIVFGIIAVLGIAYIQPAQAQSPKSLVIIDSYFDSKVNAPNIKCITLQNIACTDVVIGTNSSVSHEFNHGNAMAEVAKRQSSSIPITLLRSTTPNKNSVSGVNAGNFIDALTWVSNNSSSVGAVSVSRFFTNPNGRCSPSSVNTASYGGISKADLKIRELIATLKSNGIPVFASTGNKRGSSIDYPACITDTVSVTTGSLDSSGTLQSGNAIDANTDYAGDSAVFSFTSAVFGLIPNTTSASTVAVASKYLISGFAPNKVVPVNP